MKKALLFVVTAMLISGEMGLAQSTGSVPVSGQANIFGAGLGFPPGGGATPPSISFPASPGQVITFPSVTGVVSFGNPFTNTVPDGLIVSTATTNFFPQGGISGLIATPIFFLVGVFLTDSPATAPPPPTLSFSGNPSFTDLSPAIAQTFFIGDGLTGTGTGNLQRFHVPPTATRLFFGFADGNSFQGNPMFYDDNSGTLTVNYAISAGCQVQACGLGVTDNCVSVLAGDPSPEYIQASFKAPNSMTLANYATTCGYDHFNWQNRITHNPAALAGSTIEPRMPGPLIASGNVAFFGTLISPQDRHCVSDWIGCSLIAPPTYFDPPEGSYTYLALLWNPFPYYIPSGPPPFDLLVPRACLVPGDCPPLRYVISDDGTTFSFADAPADNNLSGEAPSTYPRGNFIAFSTALVGVDSQGNAHTLPGGSWTWNSTFSGTAGGVHQTAIIHPIDPGSGTGGITITSVNGVPQTPPSVSCTVSPNTLWPPNGKSVLVAVSGVITPGTQSIPPGGTAYAMIDEYGQVQPSGSIALGAGGSYSFGVSLIAARNGDDKDGRTYTIMVGAKDNIGNLGSCSTVVTVPHDQGN